MINTRLSPFFLSLSQFSLDFVMDVVTLEKRYLKTMMKFLKLAGIWPDQNKIIKYLRWTLMYLIMMPCIFVQIARVMHFQTTDIAIEQMPFIFASLLLLFKQANYSMNPMKMKYLLRDMYEDWSVNRSEEECRIMKTYAERGFYFNAFYLANAYLCSVLFMQVPWTARLLDLIKSRNASMIYVVPGYYFTQNEEKYYYYMQIQMTVVVVEIVIVYVACDTSYMTFVQHACGLLSVAGYRFKYAIGHCNVKDEKSMKENYSRVRLSIKAHQRAIAYLQEIEEAHFIYLFICIGLVLFCFSITLLKVATMEICIDFYKYVGFLVVQLMHLFFLTIQGQFVINCDNEVYDLIYEAMWYESDPRTRSLYLLALRRMLTPPRLTAGGLVELNMQSFSEVIKLAVSYYTVLKST